MIPKSTKPDVSWEDFQARLYFKWEYNICMERYRIVEDVGLCNATFTVLECLPVFMDETACTIATMVAA
jgi:hypothetical protein